MNSKFALNLLNKHLTTKNLLINSVKRNFGIVSEYNDRKNKKLTNGYLVDAKP
jgi:hypothetical protein